MPRVHIDWFWLLFFLSLAGYVIWTWVSFLKSSHEGNSRWGTTFAIAGLCCASISTVLDEFLYIHATLTGGYPFYHPVELFCIRLGMLTAVLGIVSTVVGTGRVRLHVAIISIFKFIWRTFGATFLSLWASLRASLGNGGFQEKDGVWLARASR